MAFFGISASHGRDVADAASKDQPTARKQVISTGSPMSPFPSMETNEWHVARTADSFGEALRAAMRPNLLPPLAGPLPEFDSFVACEASVREASTTPSMESVSVVIVPVLSKRQCVSFPAKGTLCGSVQKTPARRSVMIAVFTATAMVIGSDRGTTLEMMMTHFSTSSYRVLSPFSRPFFMTYPDAIKANTRSTSKAMVISCSSAFTARRSVENSIICSNLP
mmetsp:Transcript_59885/g.129840  ORF Transcript_59885/g.129840 Transcript_59885/m.129840 type:complete len:222 (+) Transcript_59885:2617-3282(+)